MTKRYKSEALAAAHETALGLTESGVMAKRTMRAFDEMCLTPVEEMTPKAISRASASRACEPGGVRALPQRDHEPGEPVGARREAAAGRFVEAVDADRGRTAWARSRDGVRHRHPAPPGARCSRVRLASEGPCQSQSA